MRWPHTATIWTKLPEDQDGRAGWRRAEIHGCHCEYSVSDVTTKRRAFIVLIPGTASDYVDPSNYDGSTGWTLRNDDYIAQGIIKSDTPIGQSNAYEIHDVTPYADSHGGVYHWEVTAV